MNVYDFDKTIYNGDSTLDFYLFCLKRQPLLLLVLPLQILGFVMYKLGVIKKLQFKECFYIFLKYTNNTEDKLNDFWKLNKSKIQYWYLTQQKENDLVISASPEFLLKPICSELGIINLIASKVDIQTGKCMSENCYGQEKTKRFFEQFQNESVQKFYSDSLTDTPMARLAKESYGVIGEQLISWKEFECLPKQRSALLEFLLFIVVGVINTFNGVVFATLFTIWLNGTNAFLAGYACSLFISYMLNSVFVFKKALSFMRFVKFCISYIPNFIIQFIIVLVFFNVWELPEFIVYSISAILGVPITFLMVKFFALRK